jgi:uncharacterized protein YndB with AHSA1/START domain
MSAAGDGARVSVFVAVSPADAFDVFTNEIDLWWGRGPKFRIAGKRPGVLAFEAGVGGRLFETCELASGTKTFEVGHVTAWEPARRIAFEWRGVNFRPGEVTFVEIDFEAKGDGTLVTVLHRGWAALRPDHPARHGNVGAAFDRMIGLWWGQLLSSLREYAPTRIRTST